MEAESQFESQSIFLSMLPHLVGFFEFTAPRTRNGQRGHPKPGVDLSTAGFGKWSIFFLPTGTVLTIIDFLLCCRSFKIPPTWRWTCWNPVFPTLSSANPIRPSTVLTTSAHKSTGKLGNICLFFSFYLKYFSSTRFILLPFWIVPVALSLCFSTHQYSPDDCVFSIWSWHCIPR